MNSYIVDRSTACFSGQQFDPRWVTVTRLATWKIVETDPTFIALLALEIPSALALAIS